MHVATSDRRLATLDIEEELHLQSRLMQLDATVFIDVSYTRKPLKSEHVDPGRQSGYAMCEQATAAATAYMYFDPSHITNCGIAQPNRSPRRNCEEISSDATQRLFLDAYSYVDFILSLKRRN